MSEPWICPRCQTVNAPWMPQCTCSIEIRVFRQTLAVEYVETQGMCEACREAMLQGRAVVCGCTLSAPKVT